MKQNIYSPPETNVVSEVNSPALWNPNAAGLWSVLLTPAFGSVLLLKNWQALNDGAKVRAGRIWLGISVFMALLQWIVPFQFVAVTPMAMSLAQLAYLIIWYFVWQKPQTKYVQERCGTQYIKRGWFVPIFVGIVCSIGAISIGAALEAFVAAA